MKLRVYVGGPITKGDYLVNVRSAVDAAEALREADCFPYVPHLTAFWHFAHPRHYEDWMAQDFEWLSLCHAMLRIPGESAGADREEAYAIERGIPVFKHILDLLMWRAGLTERGVVLK